MMNSLRWIPIAFIADIHGFALFAPYALLILAAVYTVVHVRSPAPAPATA